MTSTSSPSSAKRVNQIQFKVNDHELECLIEGANRAGYTLSEYLRRICLAVNPSTRGPTTQLLPSKVRRIKQR